MRIWFCSHERTKAFCLQIFGKYYHSILDNISTDFEIERHYMQRNILAKPSKEEDIILVGLALK